MRKIISLEKSFDGFYILEYEFKIPFIYKKIYKKKIFKSVFYWRFLDTGNEIFGDITISLDKLADFMKTKDIIKITL